MTTDRDRSIERLLRSRLPSEHKALDVDCPDAETLAGLADDTLIAVARHEVEAHVADCHRCQMLMAAMVRSEASMDRSAAEAAADAPSWRRRALNWLVPAAAAATAIALWVIVPGQRAPLPGGPTPERQIAVSAPAVPPEAPSSQTLQAPPETLRRESASAPVDARADAQAPARDASVGFERTAPAAAPAAAPVEESLKADIAAEQPLGRAAASQEARRENAAPEQEQSVAGGRQQEPSVAGGRQQGQSVAGGRQASGPGARGETATRQSADQQERVNESAKREASAPAAPIAQFRTAAVFDVVSPNPQIRWRIGPGPVVQYSADGGASWAAQPTGASADLSAGSAPAPDVCWLVGRGGLVLRTTNGGRQWQRATFPETVDVIAVTASTGLDATVDLADGRRLRTTDGGRTWAPVR